jgi:hypothetical protein
VYNKLRWWCSRRVVRLTQAESDGRLGTLLKSMMGTAWRSVQTNEKRELLDVFVSESATPPWVMEFT